MPRKKKNYRLTESPQTLIGEPGNLIVNALDTEGQLERCFDFSAFNAPPVLAQEVAFAFHHYCVDKRSATRIGVYNHLKYWFQFVAEYSGSIARMQDVSSATLNAYIAWLNSKPWTISVRHHYWSCFKQIIIWLKRYKPELIDASLEIPFNAFPRKNAATKPREALSRSEIDRVLVAACADIRATWLAFTEAKRQRRDVDYAEKMKGDRFTRKELNELGLLLTVIVDRFGGIVPSTKQTLAKGSGLSTLHFAIQDHGGVRAIAKKLYTVPETTVPYMIAIGAQTFANPEGLRNMRRNCMNEHLLLNGRVVVHWNKGRSTQEQRRSFLRDKHFSVPNLLDQVLELTSPLVQHVPPKDRDKLFLIDNLSSSRTVGLIPDYLVAAQARRFVKRHGLLSDSGKPLNLTIAALRSTGLTLAHERLGHDILKTQILANHVSPDTTLNYIDRPLVQSAQQKAISDLQRRFVQVVREHREPTSEAKLDVITEDMKARNATAAGFVCKDPFGGLAEGQRKGELCTAWLGCFTCPNAVIPLDVEMLVRLLATREALTDAQTTMDAERWQLLYAPKLEILNRDVLSRFPLELLETATQRDFPALPPIE